MLCLLKDFEKVHGILTSKELVGVITDDNSPEMWTVAKLMLSNPSKLVLMPSDGTMFTFTSVNSILFEAHLTTTQGDKANVYENTLKTAEWLIENTLAETLVSHIPVIYESTLHYSEKIGMSKVGELKNSYVKSGELIDIIIMSCTVKDIIRRLEPWRQQ